MRIVRWNACFVIGVLALFVLRPQRVDAGVHPSFVQRSGYALGDTLADAIAPNQFDSETHLRGLRGKWVVLVDGAKWSSGTATMGADVQRIYESWYGHPSVRLEIVTNLADGQQALPCTLAEAQVFANQSHIMRPVLHSDGVDGTGARAIRAAAGDVTFPTVRIIDPAGVIRLVQVGSMTAVGVVQSVAALANVPAPQLAPVRVWARGPHTGTMTIQYANQLAISPLDCARLSGWSFPFQVTGFGENVTVNINVIPDPGTQTESWQVDFFHWDDAALGLSSLPVQRAWTFYLTGLSGDDAVRSTAPAAEATLSIVDLFGVQQPAGLTVPVSYSGNGLTIGPIPGNALANLPPIRELTMSDITVNTYQGVSVGGSEGVRFAIRSPSPNPASVRTRLAWTQTRQAQARLEVFDVHGRMVQALLCASSAPGAHTADWNLADDAGNRVSAGLYLIRLRIAGDGERMTRLSVVE